MPKSRTSYLICGWTPTRRVLENVLLRRTLLYASFPGISDALHANIFYQHPRVIVQPQGFTSRSRNFSSPIVLAKRLLCPCTGPNKSAGICLIFGLHRFLMKGYRLHSITLVQNRCFWQSRGTGCSRGGVIRHSII